MKINPARFLSLAALVLAVVSCASPQEQSAPTAPAMPDPMQPLAISTDIKANDGGEIIHPAGARLILKPGALSDDTTVTLTNQGYRKPSDSASIPLINLSQDYEIDLGGSSVVGDAVFEINYPEETSFDLRIDHLLLSHLDSNGNRMLRIGVIDEEGLTVSRNLKDLFAALEEEGPPLQSITVTYLVPVTVPDVSASAPPTLLNRVAKISLIISSPKNQAENQDLLHVPYYNQSTLSWCTPTALSMLFKYHGNPFGVDANWEIAGAAGMDRDTKGWANWWVMKELGIPEGRYEYLLWDDELLRWPQEGKELNDDGEWELKYEGDNQADSLPIYYFLQTPFTSYVKYQIEGLNLREQLGEQFTFSLTGFPVLVDVPLVINDPRPVQVTADQANHAFVIVGASDEQVWVHDSSGAVGAERPASPMSWAEFKVSAFKETENKELRSIVIHAAAAPEAGQHGSILLCDKRNCSGPDNIQSSLVYFKGSGQATTWRWDGDPYSNGYFWDDDFDQYPDDPDFENAFAFETIEDGSLIYDLFLANATDSARSFSLSVQLFDSSDMLLAEQTHDEAVPPFSWSDIKIHDNFDTDVITEPGDYSIRFQLEEGGVLQDEKVVEFRVAEKEFVAVEDCLVGDWQVDNQSYTEFLQFVMNDAGEDMEVSSVDGIFGFKLDADGQVTNYSENFSFTACSSEGCFTLPINHSGNASYTTSGDVLTITGGQFVAVDVIGTTGTAETEGGSAKFECSEDTLILELEGFPPLVYHRIE